MAPSEASQNLIPDPATVNTTSRFREGCLLWFVRDGRLRSGWRVALYALVIRVLDLAGQLALGLAVALAIGIPLFQSGAAEPEIRDRITSVLSNIFAYPALALGFEGERVAIVLLVVLAFRRLLDRRSFRSLGFQLVPRWWAQVLAGIAFSVAFWSVIFLLSLALGATTITGFEWTRTDAAGVIGGLALGIFVNLLVGIGEETDARGYMLHNLTEDIRLWPAILVSSLYFAVLHLLNPGAGLTSTLGIFFAGILLALGYYATGQLWFSIGMHVGWNLAEGPIFGFLVSGLNMGGLFRLNVVGPDWLMGGAFGPEAGALAVGIEVVMILVLFLWSRTRRAQGMVAPEGGT